jgi:hypothetical protein
MKRKKQISSDHIINSSSKFLKSCPPELWLYTIKLEIIAIINDLKIVSENHAKPVPTGRTQIAGFLHAEWS